MSEKQALAGIHHVTAIASDPQRNLNFYTGVLGLRLVKITVNFDDPGSYHFYYGDQTGKPGTLLTFFAWPGAVRGRQGASQITELSFSIPLSSLGYWLSRLLEHGISYEGPHIQMPQDEQILTFRDPDGMVIELVANKQADKVKGWQGGSVPEEHAIRGIDSVTIWEDNHLPTSELLSQQLGFKLVSEDQNVLRYLLEATGNRPQIKLRATTGFWHGKMGAGSIHHVAWRVTDDEAQEEWLKYLKNLRLPVTPVKDREYFHSIYFPEPGGVLFEIATDLPGFMVDESIEQLGTDLKLPSWLETSRAQIKQALPVIQLPGETT